MKKAFILQVEYPDNDVIPSSEVIEVIKECIENHLEKHFGANIMDGEQGRLKLDVSEVYIAPIQPTVEDPIGQEKS